MRFTAPESCATASAITFYLLRSLAPAVDRQILLWAIVLSLSAFASALIWRSKGVRPAARWSLIVLAFGLGGVAGSSASLRVRIEEGPLFVGVPPHSGRTREGSGRLRVRSDARPSPTDEFQLWADLEYWCDELGCATASGTVFVRDVTLSGALSGDSLLLEGALEPSDDMAFFRLSKPPELIAGAGVFPSLRRAGVMRFRRAVAGWPARTRGVFSALFAGDRTSLPVATERRMREAGAAHVLALSGMHLGILALAALVFLRRIVPIGTARTAVCLFALAYLTFAGLRPSLVRAVVMLVLARVLQAREGRFQGTTLLCLSFLMHQLLLPTDLPQLGFTLSFASLAGLMILAPLYYRLLPSRLPRFIRAGVSAGLAAQTTTAPLVFHVFGTVHPAGIIASILLTPLAVATIAIGSLGLILSAGYLSVIEPLFLMPLEILVELMESIATLAASFPSIQSAPALALFMATGPFLFLPAWIRYALLRRAWQRRLERELNGKPTIRQNR